MMEVSKYGGAAETTSTTGSAALDARVDAQSDEAEEAGKNYADKASLYQRLLEDRTTLGAQVTILQNTISELKTRMENIIVPEKKDGNFQAVQAVTNALNSLNEQLNNKKNELENIEQELLPGIESMIGEIEESGEQERGDQRRSTSPSRRRG